MAVLGGGGTGSAGLTEVLLLASTTWTPAFDCKAYVYVIGGGGSGGAATSYQIAGYAAAASGGAGGGAAVSLMTLSAGVTYTATIGAGGAYQPTFATPGNDKPGNAGSATTFSGSDIATMTGNGGNGGNAGTSISTSLTATGATGGTATGGTLGNYTGGSSGDATTNMTTGYGCSSTGGGSIALLGPAQSSGTAHTDNTAAGNRSTVSGGAGLGFPSKNQTNNQASGYAGGSIFGPNSDLLTIGGFDAVLGSGVQAPQGPFLELLKWRKSYVAGGDRSERWGCSTDGETGAGLVSARAGWFGAGGGCAEQDLATHKYGCGAGEVGGCGGGGGTQNVAPTYGAAGGIGGSGFVFIKIIGPEGGF